MGALRIMRYVRAERSPAERDVGVVASWVTRAQVPVAVYTNSTDSTGYCQISQIDTGSAGG